ncbi:MAG: hypothetical protein AB7E36_08550 [Salinivirgaceae bacterium]
MQPNQRRRNLTKTSENPNLLRLVKLDASKFANRIKALGCFRQGESTRKDLLQHFGLT